MEVMMSAKPIEQARCAVLRASFPALRRAALRAHELAARTGTEVIVSRNGVIERIRPSIDCMASNIVEPQETGPAPWVTAEHVAQHLGVDKKTVYRWRVRNAMPAHRVGRLWKFQLSEIDGWVRTGGADDKQQKQID